MKTFFARHAAEGTHGGGVHPGDDRGKDVTECTGAGRGAISDQDLNEIVITRCAIRGLELADAGDRPRPLSCSPEYAQGGTGREGEAAAGRGGTLAHVRGLPGKAGTGFHG